MDQCFVSRFISSAEQLTQILSGLGEGLLRLQHLNDDLLLLDEESAQDTLPQTAVAQHTAVRAAHGLLSLGHAWPLAGTTGPDSLQLVFALAALGHITTLLHVLVDQFATGSTNTETETVRD